MNCPRTEDFLGWVQWKGKRGEAFDDRGERTRGDGTRCPSEVGKDSGLRSSKQTQRAGWDQGASSLDVVKKPWSGAQESKGAGRQVSLR